MQNFKHRDFMGRDGGGEYRYRTGELGHVIEVELYYSKGGANYFSGSYDKRGIYASIKPVEVKADGSVGFIIGKGVRTVLVELKAKSNKTLEKVAQLLDADAPKIAEMYVCNEKAAIAYVKQQVEQMTGAAVVKQVQQQLAAGAQQ